MVYDEELEYLPSNHSTSGFLIKMANTKKGIKYTLYLANVPKFGDE